ncbi:MAG TPA: DUF6494 family protein [Stellaceae bacterium]|nr:DUF6494 family protein [Stellaceae bacterium]
MDEDKFNMEVRKFLKLVGVTSQREIEKAVRAALAAGRIREGSPLAATMRLTIPSIGFSHDIDGTIEI